MEGFWRVFEVTGLGGFTVGNLVMDLVGIVFIYIAIKKHYEPLLLIPIGFGILLGNVPPILIAGEHVFYTSISNPNSQMYFLYYGVLKGIYQISGILSISKRLVETYIAIVKEHHPEIIAENQHLQEQMYDTRQDTTLGVK